MLLARLLLICGAAMILGGVIQLFMSSWFDSAETMIEGCVVVTCGLHAMIAADAQKPTYLDAALSLVILTPVLLFAFARNLVTIPQDSSHYIHVGYCVAAAIFFLCDSPKVTA